MACAHLHAACFALEASGPMELRVFMSNPGNGLMPTAREGSAPHSPHTNPVIGLLPWLAGQVPAQPGSSVESFCGPLTRPL